MQIRRVYLFSSGGGVDEKKTLKSSIWYPASIRLSIRVSVRRSILMRLYSPVDLAGNMNMIEKLVLGVWDWNRGPPDPQPGALTSAPSRHVYIVPGAGC